MPNPKYLENLKRYGPKAADRAADLEEMAALANARPSQENMREANFRAIVGQPSARRNAARLAQAVSELGDQYKREARGVEAPEDEGIISRIKSAAGMKKGGKVASASKRADGIAQRGKTKGRMI